MKIKSIGLTSKDKIVGKIKDIKKIIKHLKEKKVDVRVDDNLAKELKMPAYTRNELMEDCQVVIIFGGDGTILKTAGTIGKHSVKILGINYGNLGFLTELMPEDLFKCLDDIIYERVKYDKRELLQVTHIRDNKKLNKYIAMNDAVINQGMFSRIIDLHIDVNDAHVVEFKADGMIIATPTGSTAHSLSAGGPIVHPAIESIILTPICSSTLSLRPIVIPNNQCVKITIGTERSKDLNLGLTIDGQTTVPLQFNDVVKVEKSKKCVHMLRLGKTEYYSTLRNKLGWGKVCK